ncbi:MAG: metal ABC transporter permease [Amylibacter sp.]
MTIFDSFLVRAALAGQGVALAAAPLGCFVVWRRMAYFGDATAHAAILGVALALALNISVMLDVFSAVLLAATLVSTLSNRGFAMDTLLGVMAHSALEIGLVAVSFLSGVRVDLMAYLFGDILAVRKTDLAVIWAGAILVLALVGWRWSALLTATLNTDLAHASGIDPKREQLILAVTLAIVIAVAIKVVGVLLIASLLVIPAAAARPFSTTPERLAVLAMAVGVFSALGGLYLAFQFDTPNGPTIVCLATGFFALASLFASFNSNTR